MLIVITTAGIILYTCGSTDTAVQTRPTRFNFPTLSIYRPVNIQTLCLLLFAAHLSDSNPLVCGRVKILSRSANSTVSWDGNIGICAQMCLHGCFTIQNAFIKHRSRWVSNRQVCGRGLGALPLRQTRMYKCRRDYIQVIDREKSWQKKIFFIYSTCISWVVYWGVMLAKQIKGRVCFLFGKKF